ncbi:plasmid mobilization protein [Fodinibius salsisoli]|uniref:Plasmid mobilization relaxosome protein MobC n=1 Tax=Fodinibius salsisoli TaxID=2820877 RepID=A0ABT3PH20_9BACT|nr:plasmid mobilization relaxosome protein MobC [Fodinibius salsisoli]MCW9705220.1 plasmid mobilization relaxosome protein MobC [Fodinibius salsisoli]
MKSRIISTPYWSEFSEEKILDFMEACFQNLRVEGLREIVKTRLQAATGCREKDGKQVPLVPDSRGELAKGRGIFRICDALNVNQKNNQAMENDNNISHKKESNHRRDYLLKIYLTKGEKARIKKMAKTVGIKYSAFGRSVLLDYEFPKDLLDLRKIRYELNKIGVNLNQIARVANRNGQLPSAKQITQIEHQLLTTLEEL